MQARIAQYAHTTAHLTPLVLASQTSILTNVKAVLDLDPSDPTKEDRVKVLRKEINDWVAAYRWALGGPFRGLGCVPCGGLGGL